MEGTGTMLVLLSFWNQRTFYFVESCREGTRQRRLGPPYFKKPSGRALMAINMTLYRRVSKTCYFGDCKDPPVGQGSK